jgi:hypothetical protein
LKLSVRVLFAAGGLAGGFLLLGAGAASADEGSGGDEITVGVDKAQAPVQIDVCGNSVAAFGDSRAGCGHQGDIKRGTDDAGPSPGQDDPDDPADPGDPGDPGDPSDPTRPDVTVEIDQGRVADLTEHQGGGNLGGGVAASGLSRSALPLTGSPLSTIIWFGASLEGLGLLLLLLARGRNRRRALHQ